MQEKGIVCYLVFLERLGKTMWPNSGQHNKKNKTKQKQRVADLS
jgi:hypothetical protein